MHLAGWASPLLAGAVGGLLATWGTFARCLPFMILAAPFMKGLRANKALSTALPAVTAAMVGVIQSLMIWFADMSPGAKLSASSPVNCGGNCRSGDRSPDRGPPVGDGADRSLAVEAGDGNGSRGAAVLGLLLHLVGLG
jgi:hypothetical protein